MHVSLSERKIANEAGSVRASSSGHKLGSIRCHRLFSYFWISQLIFAAVKLDSRAAMPGGAAYPHPPGWPQ
jgi:hypothetical protein